MDQDIRAILEAAILAPSGENSQPWRFKVSGSIIEQYNHSDADQSLYNYNNFGVLTAHGAALENIKVAASALGYEIKIDLIPDSGNPDLIAIITLDQKGAPNENSKSLFDIISKRCTNRKAYQKNPLSQDVLDQLRKESRDYTDAGLRYIRIVDNDKVKKIARVASTNEEVMLGNQSLHHFFFSSLTWTVDEDEAKKRGFYIKTLELPLPVQYLFRVFAYWPIMKLLRVVGFPALVGSGNAATYAASSELGVITIPKSSSMNYLLAGQLLEHLWLVATRNGLSFQPLTGTLFLSKASEQETKHFSGSDRKKLMAAQRTLKSVLTEEDNEPVLMFRIGYAKAPSAKALRFSFEELVSWN